MKQHENIDALVHYRIEQAKDSVETVILLIENGKYSAAVNRIYYGMFYMLLAVAAREGFETSKHQQLIGWFNKTFIKEELLPKRYGSIISKVFKSRKICDYEAFVEISKDEVMKLFNDMKNFIQVIEDYLNDNK